MGAEDAGYNFIMNAGMPRRQRKPRIRRPSDARVPREMAEASPRRGRPRPYDEKPGYDYSGALGTAARAALKAAGGARQSYADWRAKRRSQQYFAKQQEGIDRATSGIEKVEYKEI